MTCVYRDRAIPRVENIKLSREQKEEIDKLSKGESKVGRKYIDKFVSKVERRKIKAIIGGFCCLCRSMPSKKVSYDQEGAKLIEWYCEECWHRSGIK